MKTLARLSLRNTLAVLLAFWCGSTLAQAPAVTRYTHDVAGNLSSVTDPRGLVTTYTTDGLGLMWQQVSPDTGTTSFTYDAYGRTATMTRADGTQTAYGYDVINRRTSVSAGGLTQSFEYDGCTNGIGRLCSASGPIKYDGTYYQYTQEGWISRQTYETAGKDYAMNYLYDNMGHLASVTYPDQTAVLYSYGKGVVSGVTIYVYSNGGFTAIATSRILNITYRPFDEAMASWTSGNGLVNTLNYDSDGRLTALDVPGVQSHAYTYDAANQITGLSDGIMASQSETLGYDALSRLTSVTSSVENESYQYDANGNRIAATVNGAEKTYTYSANSNQLLSASVTTLGTATYGYDAQGNTSLVNGAASYQYDPFNRLSSSGGATNDIDPEGQRLNKSGGSTGTTLFAPDSGGELLAENDNGTWVDYVRLNGRLIGRISGSTIDAIHTDQVGRPEVVTDANKAIVWQAQNFPFTQNVKVANRTLNLGFPGQYYDMETMTWNNGFRDYNSGFGRYLQSDPAGLAGGINTYAYVGNNPLNGIDPYGLWTLQLGLSFTYNLSIPYTSIGIAGTAGAGVALDSTDQIAGYEFHGGGIAAGTPGADGGVQLAGSNADTIQDLGGKFGNLSINGGDGVAGSADGFYGKSADGCKNVGGLSLTAGGGGGAFIFSGATTTNLSGVGHLW